MNARTWRDVGLSFRDRDRTGTLYVTATGGLDVDTVTMVGEGVGTPPAAEQNSTGPSGAARTEGRAVMEPRTDVDRRNFLRLAGGTVAVGAAALSPARPSRARRRLHARPDDGDRHRRPQGTRARTAANIGIQLYSIRDKVSSLGFRAVFERLSAIG